MRNIDEITLSDLYFSTNGRIPRSTIWIKFTLIFSVIYLVGIGLDISSDSFDSESLNGPISGLFIILCFYPNIVGSIKRAHDRNRSGWFILFSIIPFVNIWVLVELYFLKGTNGNNNYGVDPLSNNDVIEKNKKTEGEQKHVVASFDESKDTIEEKLNKLNNLLEKGLLTQLEFDKKKQQIIDSI